MTAMRWQSCLFLPCDFSHTFHTPTGGADADGAEVMTRRWIHSPPDREPQTPPKEISTAPVTAVRFASITSIYELELEKRVLYAL